MKESKQKTAKAVAVVRKDNGLAPIRIGERLCLCCSNKFLSEDLTRMKTCNYCRLKGDVE